MAIEDERFYKHQGVDIKRTGSAIISYIFHFGNSSYGGSTITQQLVKNMTGDNTDSIFRKVKEWWQAWNLECITEKDEILETYLNIIYVGPSIYGVEAGSNYYFSKSCKNLTLEESAFLAGINNSPNSYNPFGEKDNSEKIKNRTNTVLAKMLELGYIDEAEYNEATANVDAGLKFKKGSVESSDGVYSYHTDALITDVTNDIAKKYDINVNDLKSYNNLSSNLLNIGQTLLIPKTSNYETYIVVSGDSLYKIANKFNTTIDKLKSVNNLKNDDLSIGQVLIIPS